MLEEDSRSKSLEEAGENLADYMTIDAGTPVRVIENTAKKTNEAIPVKVGFPAAQILTFSALVNPEDFKTAMALHPLSMKLETNN